MASAVDICNLALSHVGDSAKINAIEPPDGSAQAAHCARFYPIARDAVVESHNWNFALRRLSLALLDTDELPDGWAYAYAYPTALRVIAVLPPGVEVSAGSGAVFDENEFALRSRAYPFAAESLENGSQVIYTNVEDATAHIIVQTTDTTKFTPWCVLAISRLLASFLAGPVIKGTEGMKVAAAQRDIYEKLDAPRARALNSQSGLNTSYNDFVPDSLAARR